VNLFSPKSEVKYEITNTFPEENNVAPDIKELAAKIQQHTSHQLDTLFELGHEFRRRKYKFY
jgi:hypothetical protein